jgi:hypothetical protein
MTLHQMRVISQAVRTSAERATVLTKSNPCYEARFSRRVQRLSKYLTNICQNIFDTYWDFERDKFTGKWFFKNLEKWRGLLGARVISGAIQNAERTWIWNPDCEVDGLHLVSTVALRSQDENTRTWSIGIVILTYFFYKRKKQYMILLLYF